ncbi:hypothetical protein [Anabaena sp. CCY 9910]|uniref:hypothetical protein n=1 Tax=Anabaena sp. CCY 9910 TaxID=3103870 RepID=UPI0039E14BA1
MPCDLQAFQIQCSFAYRDPVGAASFEQVLVMAAVVGETPERDIASLIDHLSLLVFVIFAIPDLSIKD